ncbi:MAG: GNVR domain-containing protein [Nitrospira sp.]|nr:GNVR domain-containing protein [Nitrospira sp.]
MEHQGQTQIQFEDYIEIIIRRKWFVIIPFIISIIGVIVALLIMHPMYKSSTLILVEPQKVPETYVKATVTEEVQERLNTISQQVMSRTRLESVIKEFDLYHGKKDKMGSEEIVELMRKNIEVDVKGDPKKKELSAFSISFSDNSPEIAMNVTNRLASLFIEENLKAREQQAEGTTEFLENQLEGLKTVLETYENQIKIFKQRYMGELPTQLETNLRTLDRFQLDIQTTNDSLRGAEERKITLEKQLADLKSSIASGTIVENTADPVRSRLNELQKQLSQLSAIYTERHPDIIRLKNEIAETEKGLKENRPSDKGSEGTDSTVTKTRTSNENSLYVSLVNQLMDVNADIKGLREKQKEITKNISIFQNRVERMPTTEQKMAVLMRDYENTRTNYQSLLNKKLDAQLAESLEKRQKGEAFRILDPANLPVKPFKPDRLKIVLAGLAIGLGGGIGFVFLLEFIDASFRRPEDVYNSVGLPVLASVPRIGIK